MRRLPLVLAFLLAGSTGAPLQAQYPAWVQAHPLPTPDGPYAVGTRVLHLVDSTRPASAHVGTRPLTVQLWYPTRDGAGTRAPYVLEPALVDSMIAHDYFGIFASIMRTWKTLPTPALLDATPAPAMTAAGWPTLVFSHGMGVARANYTAIVTALASHGYLVVAIDHPVGGFALGPDGRLLAVGRDQMPYLDHPNAHLARDWSRDAAFVLDRLEADRGPVPIDTARIGYLGHSFGGASALDACLSDPRYRGCVDMDGSAFGDAAERRIGKPFLVLLSEPDQRDRPPPVDSADARRREEFARMGRDRDAEWRAIGGRNGAVPWYGVKLLGTGHFSFSDGPFQLPMQLQGVGATMTPDAMLHETAALLLDFFGHYLDRRPLTRLEPGLNTLTDGS